MDKINIPAFYFLDSVEGSWNSGKEENPNLGYKPRYKEGYFPVPPSDTLQDIRSEICLKLIESGIDVEVHHHEVGTAGQGEIDIRFDTLTTVADKIALYKYIVKNVARSHNLVATFMPKPLFQDNGSGMHVHTSLWKDGKNIFFDPQGYSLLSETALYYIGGLLANMHVHCVQSLHPLPIPIRRLSSWVMKHQSTSHIHKETVVLVSRIPVYSKSEKCKTG